MPNDVPLRPEPLRRRIRGAGLRALVRAAGAAPTPLLMGALRRAAPLALTGRQRDAVASNLAAASGWLESAQPGLGEELAGDPGELTRRCGHFAAEQFAHWIRLARGAGPDDPGGDWVDRLVRLDPSIEILDRVLSRGRGAIVVTAHLGNWELLCARLRRRGHEGAVVGRVRRRDSSHRWLVELRRAYGVETIPQDAGARAALAVLKRGGVLGLVTDLDVPRLDHRPVPFLGHPAPTMTAPASFARAWRAPLVPIRCVRAGDAYLLSVEEPLELRGDLERQDAELDLLRRQNDAFSRWIAEAPEQWAWYLPRFRGQP
ncbi:lysophospholipid acyltransferase family protein [Planctomycetota bacterium]|jgi:lauroyl/myristoyl acyltransferase|nr:lysophospholipid acyltransferase family protein [Planctomycetota bacterium]